MKYIPEIRRGFSPFLLRAAVFSFSDLLVSHPHLNIWWEFFLFICSSQRITWVFTTVKCVFFSFSKFEHCFEILGITNSLFTPFWDSSEEQCWIFSRIRFPFGDYTKAWFNIFWHSSCYIYHSKSLLRVVATKKRESFLLLCSKDVWYFWIQA